MRRRTGRPRPRAIGISFEGRGGGAVWRAQRILALPAIVDWLSTSAASTSERALTVVPPGWQLTLPEGWNPAFPRDLRQEGWAEHIATRRVLYFDLDQERPPAYRPVELAGTWSGPPSTTSTENWFLLPDFRPSSQHWSSTSETRARPPRS